MQTIKIAHLYYDLMNLYGENANIRALKNAFEEQNIKVNIKLLTIKNNIDFDKYDIFYIGNGTEKSQELVLKNLLKYKKEIEKAIENRKYFIITGNALDLFGQYIETKDEIIKALNIFPYYTKRIENIDNSIVGSIVAKSRLIPQRIIGFQNRRSLLQNNTNPLFKMINGIGANNEVNKEGYNYNNFYGTYFIGPLLIRNPYFTRYLVKSIMKDKFKDIKYKNKNSSSEIKAYDNYLKNFKIN